MSNRRKSAATDAAGRLDPRLAAKAVGYEDRMMRPQRGMAAGSWGGKPHFHCPACGRDTFNEKAAKQHRCD